MICVRYWEWKSLLWRQDCLTFKAVELLKLGSTALVRDLPDLKGKAVISMKKCRQKWIPDEQEYLFKHRSCLFKELGVIKYSNLSKWSLMPTDIKSMARFRSVFLLVLVHLKTLTLFRCFRY